MSNPSAVRIRYGAPRREHLTYIVADTAFVVIAVGGVMRGDWSTWWLVVAVPFAVLDIGLIYGFLRVWWLPAMTMDDSGVDIDAFGRTWHCDWADIDQLWLSQCNDEVTLLARLSPTAPAVNGPGQPPPSRMPDTDAVMLFDLSEITGNLRLAVAAVRATAGTKWRG